MLYYCPQTRSRLAPTYVEWCKPKRDVSHVASDGHTRGFVVAPTHVELASLHNTRTPMTNSPHTWSHLASTRVDAGMLAWTKKAHLLLYGALSHIWEKESSMAL